MSRSSIGICERKVNVMAFDFKKEYKAFYLPKNTPSIVTVPCLKYIAVRGHGDPNEEDGAYKQAIGLLYGIAFTIKMSKLGDHRGLFRLRRSSAGGLLVAGRRSWDRLRAQGSLQLDLRHPPAGFCDEGGLRLGGGRSRSEKESGLFQGGILHL